MSAMARRRVAGGAALMILFYLLQMAVFAPGVRADGPEPTYGTAVVDGSIDEWDLTEDYFADMIRAGGQGGQTEVLGTLYLRYDCTTFSLYVLAISTGDFDGLEDAWVKIYDLGTSELNTTEAVVQDGGVDIGFETVVGVAPGSYDGLEVHFNNDGDTVSTGKGGIPITLICGETPDEYSGRLTVQKVVAAGVEESVFSFTEDHGQVTPTAFNLRDGDTKTFLFDFEEEADTVTVDVTEADPGSGWSTSVVCHDLTQEAETVVFGPQTGLTADEIIVGTGDDILCVFTNRFTSSSSIVTTTEAPTTTTEARTTTTPATTVTSVTGGSVLGTTITAPPEVAADTLPFTGAEARGSVTVGLLALLAGASMLFAVRAPNEENGPVTDIGGWSNL